METKAGYPKSLFFFVEQFICQWIWELAAQAVFLFVDRVTEQSVSIEKDDIFKVKKVQKNPTVDFPSVAVRLVDRKMIQYTNKVQKQDLQALIDDNKVKFSVKMRVHELGAHQGDCQGTIFFSSKFPNHRVISLGRSYRELS